MFKSPLDSIRRNTARVVAKQFRAYMIETNTCWKNRHVPHIKLPGN